MPSRVRPPRLPNDAWSRLRAWLREQDLVLLVAVLGMVAGLWAFVELADEVAEGGTQRIDELIVQMLRNPHDPADPIGPRWLEEIGRDLTALGGVAVLTLATTAVAGFLVLIRKPHAMWLLLGAVLTGLMLSTVLKEGFDRPRPDLVPHLSHATTASFPSGHSMMAAIVYLTLGSLLARVVPQRTVKLYCIAVAVLVTLLVGLSRVYLGVHFPSDVLAGWTAGLVWAVLCWLVARYLQRRGTVEPENT